MDGTRAKRLRHRVEKLFLIARHTAARPAESKTRTNDQRKADAFESLLCIVHRLDDDASRDLELAGFDCLLEFLAVLGLANYVVSRTKEFDPMLLEHSGFPKLGNQIQACLPTERRKHGIGLLFLDNLRETHQVQRFDIGSVAELRISHDGRRIRIDQDHAISVLTKRLTGLRARVIEFASLADDDRAGANEQNGVKVVSARHATQGTDGVDCGVAEPFWLAKNAAWAQKIRGPYHGHPEHATS